MESGQRMPRKGRRLGSSRRRQIREPDVEDAPAAPEVEAWSSTVSAELLDFFQVCGAKDRGFVTREDLAVAKFSFLGSDEAPEMLFDWVDVERKGHLSLEEFSSGLKNIFGSSPNTHRLRRRRPLSSKTGSIGASFPGLQEADEQEKEAFSALVEQLGTGHPPSEQSEGWQLWGKLRQEDPQLAGDLEGFMVKVTGHLLEAQADKEVLELTLKKQDSDHHRKIQQLYEEMEQQIHQEKQQLQAESDSRNLALDTQMQEIMEAKEQEVQQLAEGQRELEAQLHTLSNTHQEAQSENLQLRETKRHLTGQLEEVQGQLRVTRRKLHAARGRVSWQVEAEPSVPRADEKTLDPQAASPTEHPLPRLFGDSDDWNQLLNRFNSSPDKVLQISWSPPPTPRTPSGSQTPRVVRQISISEPSAVLFHGESSSEPDGVPQSPTGFPPKATEGEGVDPEGQDVHSEQPAKFPILEPQEESGTEPEVPFQWELPATPAQEPESLGAAALQVLIPLEQGPPPPENSSPPQSPTGPGGQLQVLYADDMGPRSVTVPAKPPRQRVALRQDLHTAASQWGPGSPETDVLTLGLEEPSEQGEPDAHVQEGHSGSLTESHEDHSHIFRPVGLLTIPHQHLEEAPRAEESIGLEHISEKAFEAQGLESGHLNLPQQDSPSVFFPSDKQETRPEAEAPAYGKTPPARNSVAKDAQSRGTEGPQESTHTLPITSELEVQLGSSVTTAHPGEQGPSQFKEERNRPEDTGVYPRMAGLTPALGGLSASELIANPNYIFHVIFLGDSNVGKTSFLHLLHQNAFATGLTATVGIDFRVKNLLVDGKNFALQLWDTAGQERYHSMSRQLLRKADGVVLMYDITSQESFLHVRYWLDCLQDSGADGVVILLLGNKTDCEEERQVPTQAGQQLAQELGVSFAECSAALGHNILEPLVDLARSLRLQEDRLKGSLVEVVPESPPKKAGCCS